MAIKYVSPIERFDDSVFQRPSLITHFLHFKIFFSFHLDIFIPKYLLITTLGNWEFHNHSQNIWDKLTKSRKKRLFMESPMANHLFNFSEIITKISILTGSLYELVTYSKLSEAYLKFFKLLRNSWSNFYIQILAIVIVPLYFC